jgi:predicted  nucleic acid-binding Zn-ribbon protein
MEFFYNNWMAILGLLSAPLAYFFGGKQKQKSELKKTDAEALQQDIKAKKDLADLERDIYTRLIETINQELETRDQKINQLQETQKNLLKTIELQNGNIKHLQKMVDDYKATCDNCQVRIDKTKKAVK